MAKPINTVTQEVSASIPEILNIFSPAELRERIRTARCTDDCLIDPLNPTGKVWGCRTDLAVKFLSDNYLTPAASTWPVPVDVEVIPETVSEIDLILPELTEEVKPKGLAKKK